MSTVRIGINPMGWASDDTSKTGNTIPLEQYLSGAQAAGYEGIEEGSKISDDSSKLAPLLEQHKLQLVAAWYATSLLEREAADEFANCSAHLQMLKDAGSSIFIATECTNAIHADPTAPLSTRPIMNDAQWKVFVPRLADFAKLLEENEFQLVYYPHMGTVIQAPADIDRLMVTSPNNVNLLLDTGHVVWAGDDPVRLANNYKARISHIHTKDIRKDVMAEAQKKDWSFTNSVQAGIFTVPGDGSIDFVSLLKELPDYKGWLIVGDEQDQNKTPPAKYAKLGYDNLVKFMKNAGLN